MGQSAIYNTDNSYIQRIQFLRTSGDELLQRIQMLEIGMNRRKQQNQQPHQDELTSLHTMVRKLLQMLAEINVWQYFHMTNEQFNSNEYYYKQMCIRYFQNLMLKFNFRLKAKHIERIKRNLIDDEIDFTIERNS